MLSFEGWRLLLACKLQFFILKNINFITAVNFFKFFINLGSGSVSGSALTKNAGSGSVSGSALKPMRIRNTGCNEIEVILTDLFVFRQHGQPFHRGGRLHQPQLPWCGHLQQQQPPDRLTHCHRPPGQGQAKAHCFMQCSGSAFGSASGSFTFLMKMLTELKLLLQNKI